VEAIQALRDRGVHTAVFGLPGSEEHHALLQRFA
jgi:hypothetical protein